MERQRLIGTCLTASGEGGLHVFRLRGGDIGSLLAHVFRPARVGATGGLRYGHLMNGDEVVDEVMVHTVGDRGDVVEVSTHGGHAVRQAVVDLFAASGVALVEPEDMLSDGIGTAVRREALSGLARAHAIQALLFWMNALDGGLAGEVDLLRSTLRGNGSADASASITAARARIDALLGRASFGTAFDRPPLVLIAGPPNAGKSTLTNRLLGTDRCIVTPEPGTTRDLVGERLAIEGYPFRVLDSAGVRTTSDPVESLGVQRTLDKSAEVALVVLVVDGADPFPDDLQVHRLLGREDVLVVLNKGDLGAADEAGALACRLGRPVVRTSALAGEGLERLRETILYRSPFRGPATRDLPCPFTDRQVRCLMAAQEALDTDVPAAVAALTELLEGSE